MAKTICMLLTLVLATLWGGSAGIPSPPSPTDKTSPGNTDVVINTVPGFYTIGDCEDDEICNGNRNTVCKLDCRRINGAYKDCIYRFYSKKDGNPVYKCWE